MKDILEQYYTRMVVVDGTSMMSSPSISQVYDFSAFCFAGGFYTEIAMKTAYFGIFALGFRFP